MELYKMQFVLAFIFSLINFSHCCQPFNVFPPGGAKAIAVLKGSLNGSEVIGTIRFEQPTAFENLKIFVNITGLPKGRGELKHGLHVHVNGITETSDDVTKRCGSSGPHFNPTNKTHGDIKAAIRHVGDYGNIISDNNGIILKEFNDSVSTLFGEFNVIGRTIVLHQDEDDLGLTNHPLSKTTGNSGNRIACGVIGILN